MVFWIILGVFIWMVVGLFALGESSKRYKNISENFLMAPGIGLDFIDIPLFWIWLLLWPISLCLMPYFDRLNQQSVLNPSPIATSQLQPVASFAPGTRGIAKTALQPTGKIEVDGKLYDAQAQHGLIEANTPIEIVGKYMNRIMVKTATTSILTQH